MRIMDGVMQGLEKALELRLQRHRVLAQNVANVDTPGYKARELDFKRALQRAFEASEGGQGAGDGEGIESEVAVIRDPTGVLREDGNSVDLDRQMVKLSSNSGSYRMLSRILAKKFDLLRLAIESSRR